MEMEAPERVYLQHHFVRHSVHPSVGPDPEVEKQELVKAKFYANPNLWEHDLAFPHTIVLIGPNFHGNHYEEG